MRLRSDIVQVDQVCDGVNNFDTSEVEFADKRNRNRKIATQIREVVEAKESDFRKARLRWILSRSHLQT